MNTRTIATIAITAITTAANAQQFSLSLIPSTTTPTPGSTFTVDVVANASFGTHVLVGAFQLGRSGPGNIPTSNISWTQADWSTFDKTGNYTANGEFTRITFGQVVIPGSRPPGTGSEFPNAYIGTFTFEIADDWDGRPMEYVPLPADQYVLQVIDINTREIINNNENNITLNGFTIPSPATTPILIACVAPIVRRRRPTH